MEEAFFTEDFLQSGPENREDDAGNWGDKTNRSHPFRMTDNKLIEKAIYRVHEKHEGKS